MVENEDRRFEVGSRAQFLDSLPIRLRTASLWSRWWMAQRDDEFGIRTTLAFGGTSGQESGIREDICTVDLMLRRLGLWRHRGALVRSGPRIDCAPGSLKDLVVLELVEIVKEELK